MQRFVTKAITGLLATLILCGGQQVLAQNLNICDEVSQIRTIECKALVALYTGANGDRWQHNENWFVTGRPCGWHGVI